MINLYHTLKAIDVYKKVIIRDMLCVEYKCFLEDETFKFWTEVGCLVYCTSGKKIYSSNQEDYEVVPGSIFYLKKGAYTGRNFFDEQYCALMFFMPESFVQGFLEKYSSIVVKQNHLDSHEGSIIHLGTNPTMEGFFYSVLNYFANMDQVDNQLLEVKLDELMLNIFAQEEYKALTDHLIAIALQNKFNLRQVMEDNFASTLKLENFAELCCMSLSTFKREFSKTYQEPPGKWLLNRKIQLASKMLRKTEDSVNDIAFKSGFESSSHFIRSFKKAKGVTPAKYRTT
ncbi:AraC family transcriptional regulator [Flagellimonas nanhaiensis]|uniref:AraC family transcriptional regulator n=1 Tax=Flagellimonas nanhaiensis TaxID=2292706 RepID=A0A371JN45_9FLAO|nr:response regulator transcription factor [Allomuricauda nanhaiensis]RDY58646.1 AraC family transcriptional regulator [Allomuricauda nanhaiensis]